MCVCVSLCLNGGCASDHGDGVRVCVHCVCECASGHAGVGGRWGTVSVEEVLAAGSRGDLMASGSGGPLSSCSWNYRLSGLGGTPGHAPELEQQQATVGERRRRGCHCKSVTIGLGFHILNLFEAELPFLNPLHGSQPCVAKGLA